MGQYLLVVPSSAKPGQSDAYNAWYDGTHLADLLAIPGVVSGRRFDAAEGSPQPPPADHLAIYELELDDPATVFAEIGRRARSGEMRLTDTLDPASAKMWLYRAR